MKQVDQKKELGSLRLFLWPMKSGETFIVLSLFLILFSILFNYSILRICKDSLLINAPNAGAEVIPFVKIWGVTPFAFLLTALHLKISSLWNREKVFMVTMSSFLGFFLFFSFVCLPNLETFSLNGPCDFLESIFPVGFKGFFTMFRNWSVSVFYILAELWASIVMALLFWGFTNDVTRITDAKRFYVFFGLGGHLSNTAAGYLVTYMTEQFHDLTSFSSLNTLMNYFTLIMVGSGILSMVLFHFVYKKVKAGQCDTFALPEFSVQNISKKKKPHMGLIEGLKYVMQSTYLRNLAIMVLAYGFTINLIEISWKGQIKEVFGNTIDYMNFMGKLHIYMSFISIGMLFFCGPMLRRFGWGITAMVAPVVMLASGVLFYGMTMVHDASLGSNLMIFGMTPLAVAVWIGFWQNSFSKGAKNTLFSVTKEMAYIPLDPSTRLQGKAAIDVLGERIGKLGGSGISMLLIFIFGQVAATTPYAAFFMIGVAILWLRATLVLKKEFEKAEKEQEAGNSVAPKEKLAV